MKRQRNDGLRKVCLCQRRGWAKCPHSWHFNFKWAGVSHRFSLDEQVGEPVDSKTKAEEVAEELRRAIRAGTFVRRRRGRPLDPPAEPRLPVRDRLTVAQLLSAFDRQELGGRTKRAQSNVRSQIAAITREPLALPTAEVRPFGQWLVIDVSADTLHRFQEARRQRRTTVRDGEKAPRPVGGDVTANRSLALLRAIFNWAVRRGLLDATPFKRGSLSLVRLTRERRRSRRLEAGEGDRLLAACGTHLRAVVEAALETGCRIGELLSLQWRQVRTNSPGRMEIYLPENKTKTQKARVVPVSARLKAILEMRRCDPAGEEHPAEAYVFGNEIGQRIGTIRKAWELALKRAEITELHFHDLRREAGSRWLEGGVPLHTVKTWLGHSNISQTSTYLATTFETEHDAMKAFDEERARLQRIATGSETGGESEARSETVATKNAQEITKSARSSTVVN